MIDPSCEPIKDEYGIWSIPDHQRVYDAELEEKLIEMCEDVELKSKTFNNGTWHRSLSNMEDFPGICLAPYEDGDDLLVCMDHTGIISANIVNMTNAYVPYDHLAMLKMIKERTANIAK